MSDQACFGVFVCFFLVANALCVHDENSSLLTFLSTPCQRTVIMYFASEVPKAGGGTYMTELQSIVSFVESTKSAVACGCTAVNNQRPPYP